MKTSSQLFSRAIKAGFVAMIFWSFVSFSFGAAPARPIINPKVEFTRTGFAGQGLDNSGNTHSFLVKWERRSLDEEGFRINVTGVKVPPTLIERGSSSGVVSMTGLGPGVKLGFSVTAWKYNGSKIETSTSAVASFTMPEDPRVQGTMATPTNVTVKKATRKVIISGTETEVTDDGFLEISWNDGSTGELFNEIIYREVKNPVIPYSQLGFTNFSTLGAQKELVRVRGLVPSKTYQFQIRATQTTTNFGNFSFYSTPEVTFTMEPLSPPSALDAEVIREDTIRLSWRDNSSHETGYEVEYNVGSGAWASLDIFQANSTSATIPVPQGSTVEWRVSAVYQYTEAGTPIKVRSAYSNSKQFSTTFPAPTEVTATTSGFANSIDVSWKDNSNSEYGFNVYTRPVGTSTYFFARAVPAGTTQITIKERAETFETAPTEAAQTLVQGVPIFTPLEVGLTHEFVVRAVNQDETTESLNSSPASTNSHQAVAKDGFTTTTDRPAGFSSQLHKGGQAGQAFNLTLATSNPSNRSSWSATGLENSGLTFDQNTGVLSGSQPLPGLYRPTFNATFSNGTSATITLNLRITGAIGTPTAISGSFPDRTLGIGGVLDINLADRIRDSDSEMAVRMTTTRGNIDILLYPSVAPQAVANFMAYVNAGDYNGMIFHRLAFVETTPFVLQTGSLKTLREPRTFSSVLSRPPVFNEPGINPARWSVGAAKLGARSFFYTPETTNTSINKGNPANQRYYGYEGNPNSASTDFFINLSDNASRLDGQNGGFTTFGRISDNSQSIVTTIQGLPKGNYTNGNTTNNYNPSLDKRLIVDGFASSFSDVPMDVSGSVAPADMDINKTVRITKIAPIPLITYTASVPTSSAGIVSATITGTTLRLRGLRESLTPVAVTITARDLDNKLLSLDFSATVTRGHVAPAITRQPISQTVAIDSTAIFSVTARGTNISYSWRKNGVAINPPETGPTLTIQNTQPNNDLYDVVISNATTTISSNRVRLDTVEAPSLTSNLSHRLLELGQPFSFTATVTGTPKPTISWRRNGTSIRATTSSQLDGSQISNYRVSAASLSHAGAYEIFASNSKVVPAAQSSRVNVSVIDKRILNLQVTPTSKAIKITAPFEGFVAEPSAFVWKKNGIPVDGTPTFTNGNSKTLTISPPFNSTAHTGSYTCEITLADNLGVVETGARTLAVVAKPILPSELKGNDALPDGFLGVDYRATIPYNRLIAHTPTSFSFSGLPTGLKFDTKTGVISGRPSRAGIFPVKASAKNLAGSSAVALGEIYIMPLPVANVGTFTATISASPALNDDMGGRLNLTITDSGAYTASIILGKTKLSSARGSLIAGTGLYNPSQATYQTRVSIPRKNLPTLNVAFEIDSSEGYITGSINDGSNSADISGIRQFWHSTWNPCPYQTASKRFVNLGLNLDPASGRIGDPFYPQGSGYLSMSLGTNGVASFSGRLADGTSVTGSSMIGPYGEALFFNMLYKNTGSLLTNIDVGETNFGAAALPKMRTTGQSRWIKQIQPITTRSYQAGIKETFLKIEGMHYYPPADGTVLMGVANVATTATNMRMEYSQGGLNPPATTDPNFDFRLSTSNTVSYPVLRNAANTFGVNATTGFYSGTFSLQDGRKVTYQGLTIPAIPNTPAGNSENGERLSSEILGSNAAGSGYFLMPGLLPDLKTSKIESGKASLRPPALTILTQPSELPGGVNPGATGISYSVVVSPAQAGLTYRWRKNGTNLTIASASTATLTLPAIQESDQGIYDCIISNGPITIRSTSVTLNVNDPVTAVSASRSPSTTSVAIGSTVTFTASAQGTGLRYQWKENNVNIPGATSSTYVINSASVGGAFSVVVTNDVPPTTTGVESNLVLLAVQ